MSLGLVLAHVEPRKLARAHSVQKIASSSSAAVSLQGMHTAATSVPANLLYKLPSRLTSRVAMTGGFSFPSPGRTGGQLFSPAVWFLLAVSGARRPH